MQYFHCLSGSIIRVFWSTLKLEVEHSQLCLVPILWMDFFVVVLLACKCSLIELSVPSEDGSFWLEKQIMRKISVWPVESGAGPASPTADSAELHLSEEASTSSDKSSTS